MDFDGSLGISGSFNIPSLCLLRRDHLRPNTVCSAIVNLCQRYLNCKITTPVKVCNLLEHNLLYRSIQSIHSFRLELDTLDKHLEFVADRLFIHHSSALLFKQATDTSTPND